MQAKIKELLEESDQQVYFKGLIWIQDNCAPCYFYEKENNQIYRIKLSRHSEDQI